MNLSELGNFILKLIAKIQAWFKDLFQDAVDTGTGVFVDPTGDDIVDDANTTAAPEA